MLEPKETDIPALFLVFVVLPLVSYFLLGKWSEIAKKKDGLSLIASETALQVDNNMAIGCVMPVMQLPNSPIRQCARCFGPAATRCSQCKSVWYCSGRCQIAHWRQVHKLECEQLGKDYHHRSSLKNISIDGDDSSFEEVSGIGFAHPDFSHSSEDAYPGNDDFILSEHNANTFHGLKIGDGDLRCTLHEVAIIGQENVNAFDRGNKYETLNSSLTKGLNCSSERSSVKRSSKSRINLHPNGIEPHNKSPKSRVKMQLCADANVKVQTANESSRIKSNILQESNGVTKLGTMRVMGMKKSAKIEHLEDSANRRKKVKMIFPYEEFVKCFQFEVLNVTPRGLVNCGNSCYANVVLQCLTCTKPLIIYLLRQSHSRAGCAKDWCLVCELERLVAMLRESGAPLSPVNILMYIRSLNSQIGDGSQEDAHEFLRLLVASMQSICLEGYGGENSVDPRLQNTTFIQHMFGGCLKSKVKCLRCHYESERYENMMDLTLEIFGWVKSLEDALTQFTSSEDLDGENMYRCARCATYVRARKQLKVQEAPNILTIVLKRFQEGNYGKINKCITFPEMLDMTPFMTGTDDIPPLYMLYAVVVHLDTSNASFSGHYISYVKDLQGNWFRVDDTEVQPVELSQVMSQGAYILFYMRSYPRPVRNSNGKASRHQNPPKHCPSKTPRPSGEPYPDHLKTDANTEWTNLSKQVLVRENRSQNYADFSDEWSLFTSSDDSSFTTESTRDSFSTLDHADLPFSSIFNSLYPADCWSRRANTTTACSVFPGGRSQTRFARDPSVNVNCGGGGGFLA
ncbi:ubiquitin carboxyl-terminal hydrolase 15 [Phtheirospermum japonicum]|uniref:ubiquitinyl hydrolase 1 n=1 Tax=Phtheirospermum japonicum TaxID=374723 RepID=A0A830CG00_9LAMI|nr:ubiquitin carboxyl-terminal hydrolase 15 [Phtheirospermum japonicum]